MKRSTSVRLTLMGAVTAGGLTACDSGVVMPGNYTDVGTCTEAGNPSHACVAAQNAAFASHQASAPRFTSREECLRSLDVTDCAEARLRNPDGTVSTMFVPMMAGFILAREASRQTSSGSGGGGAFYASRNYPSQYRDGPNLAESRRPSSTSPSGSGSTPAVVPARPPNVRTTTISRSGFGSSSGLHGSGSA